MKLIFNRKEFLSTIKVGGCFAGKQKVLPILECVKFTIKNGTCWMLSYDDRNAIKTSCSVVSEEDIEFCVNKSDLETIVSLINDEDLTIDVEMENHKATIVTSSGDTVLPAEDAGEFPSLKTDTGTSDITIDANLLTYWIKRGGPFLYNDSMQLNHENLHLFVKDRKIEVFCFGYSKMYYGYTDVDSDIDAVISINRNSFIGFLNALDKQEYVTIKNGSKNLLIKTDKVMLLVRKDEFKPHNYPQLLKRPTVFEFKVSKDRLLAILKRANYVFSAGKIGLITFEYDSTGVTIKTESFEQNKSMRERIDGLEGGREFTQTYGIAQMEIAVNAISSDDVLICPTLSGSALLRIKNPDDESESTFVATYTC